MERVRRQPVTLVNRPYLLNKEARSGSARKNMFSDSGQFSLIEGL